MIGRVFSHYQIVEKLGEGGMGVVYKARDLKLDRDAALKFLSPHVVPSGDAKQRFIREAKAASAIDSPYIATIYEIDETPEGHLFIAMAYYDGATLDSMIGGKALNAGKAVDIAIQIARGLGDAHAKNIVHRDIKPSNIMLTREGSVKIVDFGLAKLSGATKITKTGETAGTASYMSPEQAMGREVDSRSDIFCLGIVLYEMLTGAYPFQGEYTAAVLHSIVHDDPKPVARYDPNIPAAMQQVIDKALKKDPASRYQNAGELIEDLGRCDEAASPLGRGPAAKKKGRRRTAYAYAALGVLSIAAILAGYDAYAGRTGSSPPFRTMFRNLIGGERSGKPARPAFAIAVAPFWGNNESAVDEGLVMQELLVRKLGEILGEEKGARILIAGKTQVPRSHAEARSLGRRLNVLMVVWGEVLALRDEMDMQPHFSFVQPLKELNDQSPQAFQTELSDPHQMKLRKQMAGEVGVLAIYAAAKYYARTDPERALSMASKLPIADSKRFILQGEILDGLGRDEESREAYGKAVSLDPKDPLPHIRLGENLEARERYNEALVEYERAIALGPNNAWPHLALASFFSGRGRRDLALASLQEVKNLKPADEATIAFMGYVYWRLAMYEDAIGQYNRAIAIAPQDAQLRISLGVAHKDFGDTEKAIAEYKDAICLVPGDPGPRELLGSLYMERAEYKEAVEAYRASLKLDPESFSAYLGLGFSFGKLGQRDRAVDCFNKALKYGRDKWPEMIHVFIGTNYRKLGWYEAAIAEFKNGESAADTQFIDVSHYEFAKLYEEMGNYEEASNEFRMASENESNLNAAFRQLDYFLSLCRLGRQEEAHARLRAYSRKLKESEWRQDEIASALVEFYAGDLSKEKVTGLAENRETGPNSGCSFCVMQYYLAMPCLIDIRVDSKASSVDTTEAVARLREGVNACNRCRQSEYRDRIEMELRRIGGTASSE